MNSSMGSADLPVHNAPPTTVRWLPYTKQVLCALHAVYTVAWLGKPLPPSVCVCVCVCVRVCARLQLPCSPAYRTPLCRGTCCAFVCAWVQQ